MPDLAQEKLREQRFHRALETVEACAGTPFVPGEMVGWLAALEEAFGQLRPLLQQQVGQVHGAELAEMSREDPEMLRHVETLQDEDRAITEQARGLQERLRVLRPLVRRVGADEKRAEVAMSEVAQSARDLVSRIRKQEVSVRTWLVEAFTRDRGVAD
jgi:hypothetical protein